MPLTPEQQARETIDSLLDASGWVVQDLCDLNLSAGRGIAVREFPLTKGHGTADYLLYGDGRALGVVEAKKVGNTLSGAEIQSAKYGAGLPASLPAWHRPLPFLYESTGVETHFTNGLDPDPRSRDVFSYHRPETLIGWALGLSGVARPDPGTNAPPGPPASLLQRLRRLPELDAKGMRAVQERAIRSLERSMAANHPRALVQMATGSGKTYTAVAWIYRLLKFAGVRRVLFLVDRSNLAVQTKKEFDAYDTPDGRKFTAEYIVQHQRSNTIDPEARVVITTIQRLYSILQGEEALPPEAEDVSAFEAVPSLKREPVPVAYNPDVPIETFDIIITDECHRSIYHLWRQVLEYFDAYLVGLTATPSKQTLGFFKGNLVMEYTHAEAVADGVNVDFDVYKIDTRITKGGSTVEAGHWIDKRDRKTRRRRWERLEEDLAYEGKDLDRSVVSPSQIRLVIQTFHDRLFTEIFPGRTEVPKTLIFAKDDNHAEQIVETVREVFGKGNDFCQKITYRSSAAQIVDQETGVVTWKSNGIKAEDLLSAFRNAFNPRIAVTVDMIATGTDVKPLEIVFFMRDVKSDGYFDQMKGRGTRVIGQGDHPEAMAGVKTKDRYVIVDAVNACRDDRDDSSPVSRDNPSVPLKRVLQVIAMGNHEPDTLSTLAGRLARLDRQVTPAQRKALADAASGCTLSDLAKGLLAAVDPDAAEADAKVQFMVEEPTAEQVKQATAIRCRAAAAPFHDPALRDLILSVQQDQEQTIDTVSQDELLEAGASAEARAKAESTVESWRQFIEDNRNEIAALSVLYSRRRGLAPTLKQLKELAEIIHRPPHVWTPEGLWRAYETLERDRVRGSGGRKVADLVALVRHALDQETILAPFGETVADRYERWLSEQEAAGRTFTPEQREWLDMIRDQVAASLSIEDKDFQYAPFAQHGGLRRATEVFGANRLPPLLAELNGVLAI